MNVVDILKDGHPPVEKSLQNLSESDWEVGSVCGDWSVKDILAHLASYEHLLKEVLGTFLEMHETPTLQEYTQNWDNFNDDQVEQRRKMTPAAIWEEYNETHADIIQLAARIPPETFRENGTIPWYVEESCLDDLIV